AYSQSPPTNNGPSKYILVHSMGHSKHSLCGVSEETQAGSETTDGYNSSLCQIIVY
ncbi:hypothetical protein HAX54_008045, partial [Datura stramonium]|nr:hypothetical protein [Datura stramonium]